MQKRALIIGLGISGQAACRLLLSKSYIVSGFDDSLTVLQSENIKKLSMQGVTFFHRAEEVDLSFFDRVVVSPGVAKNHLLYQEARRRGLEILGEASLALTFCRQKVLGITGTNGKTTVTSLIAHILKANSIKCRALGNIGSALCEYFIHPDSEEILIVELSSFQLETIQEHALDAAVILNITPDHLDRYQNLEDYAKAKCLIQYSLKREAPLFVYSDVARDFGYLLDPSYFTFGKEKAQYLWTDKTAVYLGESLEYLLPLRYRDLGMHESINVVSAWALCKSIGLCKEDFCLGLETFQKPSHRIEHIATIDGVHYYDDSKGTNIDATIQAVLSMKGSVVLLAGGVEKGTSYLSWIDPFQNRVKQIIAFGQAAPKIQKELCSFYPIEIADSFTQAVAKAELAAKEGDSVLLSPGGSSFDLFRDYVHRGEEFKKCVFMIQERRRRQ